MPISRRPLSPSAAIAKLGPDSAEPLLDAEVSVGFFADRSWLGKLIGYAGKGFWDHMTNYISDVEVIDSRDTKTVVSDESLGGMQPDTKRWKKVRGGWSIPAGVQRRPASYLDKNESALVLALPCTSAVRAAWLGNLVDQLGKPYDKLGIVGFVDDSATDPNWRRHMAWFCDCLGIWDLERVGLAQPTTTPPCDFTPGTAAMICEQIRGVRIVTTRGEANETRVRAAGLKIPNLHI